MIPVEAGQPQCSAMLEVAEGSGALMERHIHPLKQVSNGHVDIDWDSGKIEGEFRLGSFHSSWSRIDYRVSYLKQEPLSNGMKHTLVRVDVYGSGLGRRGNRTASHNEARQVLLRFLFPNVDKETLTGAVYLPD